MDIFIVHIFVGYVIDLLIGDPRQMPHPVVIIGKGIELLEKKARYHFSSPLGLKIAGAFIVLVVIAASFAATSAILWVAWQINYYFFLLAGAWIFSTTIATRGLADAALEIRQMLLYGDLSLARQRVGWIVGRDTDTMSSEEMVRATVETVSENLNDAFMAPLFYACIGGPVLAMVFRAVNTLDSMLGYKNEKYMHLGWASARLDDFAGYIPARITGLLLVLVAWLSNRNWRRALSAWQRDASSHPSPNSGIPESVIAGTLGVRLGGRNVYGGVVSVRAYMGEQVEILRSDHIVRAVDMIYQASFVAILTVSVLFSIIHIF